MNNLIIPILFLLNGLGIAIIWTKDIFTHPEIDISKGFFTAREPQSGNLLWPHWFAEYSTALLLIISTLLVFCGIEIGERILPFAAGALFYTSLNSLSWSFAKKDRFGYAFPMIFALLVSAIYLVLLFIK